MKTRRDIIETFIVALILVVLVSLLLATRSTQSTYVVPVKKRLESVYVKYEDTTSISLQVKRRSGIPDSVRWGDRRIFLYTDGVNLELARLDSSINQWRDSVKIARGL
jgi:hypothetical protein